jgi:lipoprotein-releasing system ATP-binding protein
MPPARPLLRLVEVIRRFDSPEGAAAITVLDRISLEVQSGETVAIVGPSGSGKSTLLQLIGTLDRPTSGQVLLNGKDLATLSEAEVAAVRNRVLGFVFQAHYLLPQCTVLENVLVPTLARVDTNALGNLAAARSEPANQRATRLLRRVGLADRLGHRPGQLSGGERQRVAVVRALINEPQLLLADEPTGALDQVAAAELAQLLMELNREEKVTLVVVTHSQELAARMHRACGLKNGRLVSDHTQPRP